MCKAIILNRLVVRMTIGQRGRGILLKNDFICIVLDFWKGHMPIIAFENALKGFGIGQGFFTLLNWNYAFLLFLFFIFQQRRWLGVGLLTRIFSHASWMAQAFGFDLILANFLNQELKIVIYLNVHVGSIPYRKYVVLYQVQLKVVSVKTFKLYYWNCYKPLINSCNYSKTVAGKENYILLPPII